MSTPPDLPADLPVEAPVEAPLVTAAAARGAVGAGALLVDVRSEAGRASAGELTGALVVAEDDADPGAALGVRTDHPVVVVCGSPAGSGPFTARLLALGFTDVVHVEGGFPAWQAAGPDAPGEP